MEKTPKDPKDRPGSAARPSGRARPSRRNKPAQSAANPANPEPKQEATPTDSVTAKADTGQPARDDGKVSGTEPVAKPSQAGPETDKVAGKATSKDTSQAKPASTKPEASPKSTPAGKAPGTTKPAAQNTPSSSSQGNAAIYVALLALLIAIGAGAFAAWQWQQDQGVRQDNAVLANQLANLEQDLAQQREQLAQRIEKGESSLASQQEALTTLSQGQQAAVQEARAMLEQAQERQPSDWILAEADYLVRMAERKLWLEQDPDTALALIQDADGRLASLNDNDLGSVRQSLANDIATLKALPRNDLAGVALAVEALIGKIESLPLNQTELPELLSTPESTEPTTDLSDWRSNLARSWRALTDDFITIRHRQTAVQPMMAPDQEWYLREHLKGKLMQAQLALYHGHHDAFGESLGTAHGWIRDYFDLEAASVQAALSELKTLADTDIANAVAVELTAADGLARLVRERLGRNGGR